MFKRPWQIWLYYATALAVVLPAFGWLTVRVLKLDNEQRISRQAAEHDEQVRLALWRMDSLLMPLIAQEAARPYQSYEPFSLNGEERIPSPILTQPSPFVVLNFQLDTSGAVCTPQYPEPELHEWAFQNGMSAVALGSNEQLRIDLNAAVRFDELWTQLPEDTMPALAMSVMPTAELDEPTDHIPFNAVTQSLPLFTEETSLDPGPQQAGELDEQLAFSESSRQGDFSRRNSVLQNLAQQQVMQQRGGPIRPKVLVTIEEGVSRPLWLGERLILARRVSVSGEPVIQGCWLDWESLEKSLLLEIADLVPDASLVPLVAERTADPSRMLASIPVSLHSEIPPAIAAGMTPIRVAVLTAWAGLLFGCVAIAVLLHGVHSLSERRATFVSAVTHELRTPLTTFQLYTDLLADDLLQDETKRRDYLQTLRAESQRLEHLIENVLCYSQLERRPRPALNQASKLTDVLQRTLPRLRTRTDRSNMELVFEDDGAIETADVRADPSLVEQILLNLVDNACKYAATADDRRILIHASLDSPQAAITVHDFGSGLPADVTRRLFQPFSKSAECAAESAPGVGLGLALSRGLARQMGGDLAVVDDGTPGATFCLMLPLAPD